MKRLSLFAIPLAASLLLAGVAFAQGTTTTTGAPPTITFPIPELGNCASKDACKTYCDDPAHEDACFAFGQTHRLITKDEVQQVKTLNTLVGPGGCKGAIECKAYCSDQTHYDECAAFAEAHHLGPQNSGEASSTVMRGIGPEVSGIKSSSNVGQMCRAYCNLPGHQQDCGPASFSTSNAGAEPRSGSSTKPFTGEGANVNASVVNDSRPVPPQIQERFGCSTIGECKALCAASPDKCPTRPPPPPTTSTTNGGPSSVITGLLKGLGL